MSNDEIKGFVKDMNLLDEDCRVDDLLDFSTEIESFERRLNTINYSAIVGLVGEFGSGKSTMLYQIQKKNENKQLWINFDAWKYPERKDLWEGFVIDFADQIGERAKIVNTVEGKSSASDALDITGKITDKLGILGFSLITDVIKKLINSSPAKRIFEIQEVLLTLINKQTKEIYIILEDIDRSGDAGTYFLETIKQFLSSNTFQQKIIVIVPISNENYKANEDSYLKAIDYVHDFNPKNLNLGKFVEAVFDDELFIGEVVNKIDSKLGWNGEQRKSQIISFLEMILIKYPEISFRHLKFILRKANQNYILQEFDGHKPDFRVTICIEFSKYTKIRQDKDDVFFERFYDNRQINSNTIFASFIFSMVQKYNTIEKMDDNNNRKIIDCPHNIEFITRERPVEESFERYPSYPWYSGRFLDEKKLNICDFYLQY